MTNYYRGFIFMKHFIKIISFFLIISILGCSVDPLIIKTNTELKGKEVDVYYKGEYCGSLTYKNADVIYQSSVVFAKQLDAEKDKRVSVKLYDNPWLIPVGKKYKTQVDLIWKDKNGNIVKKVNLKVDLERPKGDDECRTIKMYAYVTTGVAVALTASLVIVILLMRGGSGK